MAGRDGDRFDPGAERFRGAAGRDRRIGAAVAARLGDAAVRGSGVGLLFLDELTTAPPAVQAAMLRVVLERVVGDAQAARGRARRGRGKSAG